MEKETFKTLKRAHKNGATYEDLKRIKLNTPIMKTRTKLLLGELDMNPNFSNLTSRFSKIESSQIYKDELVINYLLFFGKILNSHLLMHIFFAPQSYAIFNWILLYKKIVYSIISLLYNKKLVDNDWINLDVMIYNLNEGYSDSVRHFLKELKLLTLSDDHKVEMEKKYDERFSVAPEEFGPLYWRIIHLMAEAVHLRKNADVAKNIWKDFMFYSFHRTLLCNICKGHFYNVVEKYKREFENCSDYSVLWFNIHNEVNKTLNKLEYSNSEFEKDRLIMHDLLIPKKSF